MSEKSRRVLMTNSFLYLIVLILALKVCDISEAGPEFVKIGLSSINVWFRNLWNYGEGMDYSKFWYSVTKIIGYVCMATCCFWTFLFVRDLIKSGRADGVDTDKNLMSTFFLYVMTLASCFILRIMKVNYGPIVMPGQTNLTCSFPSAGVLLFIVAMGSTAFHVWDIWYERKKRAVVMSVLCVSVMVFGIVAQMISGTTWLTDTLGGVLLGITLLTLYSFFFYV